ncbi:MAG: YihY family inner membrane protein [Gammaproteobacteria bacterium]|nr:YihY family inner membrane protein [Gammaproteobacteria bacterium]MCP4089186.1 YihY family inner membrane protein [Gammaproteobacteria bacterium]MCP4928442.1 YihY family inner membrane protein [Gammaproteobacteria bacterium]
MDDLLLKIEALLWSRKINDLSAIPQITIKTIRFCYAILRDVLFSTLTLRAMGLVYITILSIVPLLALIFAGLKGFGFHRSSIEPALLNVLEPLGDKGVEITHQLINVVDNVQGGLLAGVGLILLVYTAVSMIRKIEESLNHIWRVDSARSLVQRFGEYLSVVLVGPVIMLTAIALIATVGSNALVSQMMDNAILGPTAVIIGKLTPYLLVSLVFGMLYWFIPNTRVKIHYALLGGLIGGMLWAASGVLFATFVVNSTRNASIYASFAIAIVALMWLYISWLILLIGAQAAFYAQKPEYQRVGYRELNVGNQIREQAALSLMLMVAEAFQDKSTIIKTEEISQRLKLPSILLGPIKTRLQAAGLLEVTSKDHLLPSRDPGNIMLLDVIAAVRTANTTDVYRSGTWPKQVNQVLEDIDRQVSRSLEARSLYDLLNQN